VTELIYTNNELMEQYIGKWKEIYTGGTVVGFEKRF
jgi:hypothetical protein